MENLAQGRVKSIEEIEKDFKPCINVLYGKGYRAVLEKIVKVWEKSNRGVSFYDLYEKERVVRSKNGLKIILDVLTECGYAGLKDVKASTNTPRGRKEYYPTPLGIVMNAVLDFLYFKERGIEGSEAIYPLADYYVGNTLFQRLPFIYDYMLQASREGKADIKPEKLLKGFLTTLHAMNMLSLKAVEVEEKTGLPMRPMYSSKDLLEIIKNNISEDINYLEGIKPRPVEGSMHRKVLEHLLEDYFRLARALGVHGQGEGSTRVNT